MRKLFKGFTGIDAPYQSPANPDVIIDTHVVSVDRSITMIIERLAERVSLYMNELKLLGAIEALAVISQ